MLLSLFIFITTYFVSGMIIAGVFQMFLGKGKSVLTFGQLTLLGLTFGPLVISALLHSLFFLIPRQSDEVYILIIGLVFLLVLILVRKSMLQLLKEIGNCLKFPGIPSMFSDKYFVGMFFLAMIILLYVFIQGIGFPIASYDGCIYANLGKYLYAERSLENFPMLKSDAKSGFYLGGAQSPPGLALFYTWFYLLQGNSDSDILARSVSPVYAFYLLAWLWIVLKKRKDRYYAVFGVVLMGLTPIFVWQSYENSIDPLRMTFIFASFILLAELLRSESLTMVIITGATIGLGIFTHASGLLAVLVLLFTYFVLSREAIKTRIAHGCLIGMVAIIFGGLQYGINHARYNNVLGPASYSFFEVQSRKEFYSKDELSRTGLDGEIEIVRKIRLPRRLVFGRLQVFSRPELFGITYYIFIFALFYWWIKVRKKKVDAVLLVAAVIIAIPIIYKFYTNRRYIFTIHPFVIYFCGLWLGNVYIWLREKTWGGKLGIGLLIIFLVPIVAYFSQGSMATLKLSGGDKGSKIKYFLSDKLGQNRMLAPGLFEGIEYINKETDVRSVILTSDNARYFHYGRRKGIFWSEPRMMAFYRISDKWAAYDYLLGLGVDYVLVEDVYQRDSRFIKSQLNKLVEDKELSYLVFDQGTKIYRLKKGAQ